MRADSRTEAEVRSTIDQFSNAYTRHDLASLGQLFATDPDVFVYGSAVGEKRRGIDEIREQARHDWEHYDSVELVFGDTSISAAGPVAWAASDATFRFKDAEGHPTEVPARVTFVLENRNGKWLIMQSHSSEAAEEQPGLMSSPNR